MEKVNKKVHKYKLDTFNGRYRVFIDNCLMFSWNQIDYKGCYFYKDDVNLFGLDLYLKDTTMEIYFKTKENWLQINKLFCENL